MDLNWSSVGSQEGKRLGLLPASHLKCSTQYTLIAKSVKCPSACFKSIFLVDRVEEKHFG